MKITCSQCGSELIAMGGSMDTMGRNAVQSVEPCRVCISNKRVGADWNKEGNPLNLAAAAEDAYEWLIKVELEPRPLRDRQKINAAALELRKFLCAAYD